VLWNWRLICQRAIAGNLSITAIWPITRTDAFSIDLGEMRGAGVEPKKADEPALQFGD